MIEVEVPEYGTVVVQQGEVHDVREGIPEFTTCWCSDGRHNPATRKGRRQGEPHLIGVQQFELTWEVKK